MVIVSPTVVLIGLESVGKTALFRNLTGQASGDEANFRGSTVTVHSADLLGDGRLIDTPGIRVRDDSQTSQLALQTLSHADVVVLTVRGTHARQELETLLRLLSKSLVGRRLALAITFADRASHALQQAVAGQRLGGVPAVLVNARAMTASQFQQVVQAIREATPLDTPSLGGSDLPPELLLLSSVPVVEPQCTVFEHRYWGPWASLLTMLLLFGLPVYLAYLFAGWAQPTLDQVLLDPLLVAAQSLGDVAPLLFAVLAGDYGLLTLGTYSFLWAFPVVLLIGISVAVTEEIGLKDRISAALDPWLRYIGLNGRDLVPVLTGFGCNVVAVFQSRACSLCTRHACVSMIAFASACSYQIGASLSLFNSASSPWLFFPYLVLLFIVGAIHTRLWHGHLPDSAALPLAERAFLQPPSWEAVAWRVRAVVRQFLLQAMPIFLAICVIGALLEYIGVLSWLAQMATPALHLFGLPGEVAPGVIFSIVRKDGLLVLNQGQGTLLATLAPGQVLVLVYLASTLTACLVTLWTVRRELGARVVLRVAARQAITSLVSALILATALRLVSDW